MHPYLGAHLGWLVLAHVLAAFAFAILHGPSIAAMWMLRHERELPKVQTLLMLSRRSSEFSWIGWTALATTGGLLAATEHTWRAPWVWGSAVVLIVVTGIMSPLAARAFNEARSAAGLPWFDGRGVQPPAPVDAPRLAVALADIRRRSVPILLVGVLGLAALVWLMVEKPT